MLITRFDHAQDNDPKPEQLFFSQLAAEFSEFDFREPNKKNGPCWSPAAFEPGTRRAKRNVQGVHVLALDLDKITPEDLQEVRQALEGFEHVIHSTWSHVEQCRAGLGCYRVFVNIDRHVLPDEWKSFWAAANEIFGCGKADPQTKDPSRIFFTPSAPKGTEEHTYYHHALGEPLSVDEVLDAAKELDLQARKTQPKKVRSWEEVKGYKPTQADYDEAKAWLEARATEISQVAPTESIYPELNNSAYWAGTRCPHLLEPEQVRERLLQALRVRRPDMAEAYDQKTDQTFEDKYLTVIENALRDAHEKGEPYLPTDKMFKLNEDTLATKVLKNNPNSFLFITTWKTWMTWLGTHWALDENSVLVERAARTSTKELLRGLEYVDDKKYVKGARVFLKNYLKTNGRRSLVNTMRTFEEVAGDYTEFDGDPDVLNTLTGHVNLRTKEVTPHDPDQRVTKFVDIHYNPHAQAPRWERFLLECMGGDLSLVNYLKIAVGYSLTGHTQEHVLFFLHGDGRNGKTTFINAIMDILGGTQAAHSYATVAPPGFLLAKKHENHLAERVPLHGARFCSVTEVEQNRSWAESKVKELTGGEAITARRMRENLWTFNPTHKLWVSGNYKPQVRGTDAGIWSRLKLIPFEQDFGGREDRTLSRTLQSEREGILKWAIDGASEWYRKGLEEPEAIKTAVAEYRRDEDDVAQFFEEKLEVTEDSVRVAKSQVSQIYNQWAAENGNHPAHAKALTARLRKLGLDEVRVRGVRYWKGVKIRVN